MFTVPRVVTWHCVVYAHGSVYGIGRPVGNRYEGFTNDVRVWSESKAALPPEMSPSAISMEIPREMNLRSRVILVCNNVLAIV